MQEFFIAESMETMENYGTNAVSSEALLSILIGNQGKAKKLLKEDSNLFEDFPGGLSRIAGKTMDEIREAGSLTRNEAARVYAAIELGKRVADSKKASEYKISAPKDAADFLMGRLRHETHEKFLVLLLNTKNYIMRCLQISEGSLTSSIIHPREVFTPAVAIHAACILVAHNHPSGDPYPSTEDRTLTESLKEAGLVMGIPVMDHVVIGDGKYYSFKEHGEL